MNTNKNQRPNAAKSPLTEWQIYDDSDDEEGWQERTVPASEPTPIMPAPRRVLQWAWGYSAPALLIVLALLFLGAHWLHARPPARLNQVAGVHGGPPRLQKSRYFLIHYTAADAGAAAAAGDQLDRLYPALYATFFPEPPGAAKVTVSIDPTLAPGLLPQPALPDAVITIPSPATISASVPLADSEIVAQSLALALFDRMADQAVQRYRLPAYWLPLRNGLRLWFIWSHDLPLGNHHDQVVRWVFNAPTKEKDHPGDSPAPASIHGFAHELCAEYRLWMRSPVEIGVPVACRPLAGDQEQILTWRYPYPSPLQELLPIANDLPASHENTGLWQARMRLSPLAEPVALETVIEYAAATYGSERLPNLLAALPQQASWQETLPAVFGVSMGDFEQGWRAYLADHYGISH
jgi:hypothetical protein